MARFPAAAPRSRAGDLFKFYARSRSLISAQFMLDSTVQVTVRLSGNTDAGPAPARGLRGLTEAAAAGPPVSSDTDRSQPWMDGRHGL